MQNLFCDRVWVNFKWISLILTYGVNRILVWSDFWTLLTYNYPCRTFPILIRMALVSKEILIEFNILSFLVQYIYIYIYMYIYKRLFILLLGVKILRGFCWCYSFSFLDSNIIIFYYIIGYWYINNKFKSL